MPLSLQPDRNCSASTFALCLIGAVMVFSASAVTAANNTAMDTFSCCGNCFS